MTRAPTPDPSPSPLEFPFRAVAVDLETTGTTPNVDRIVEIAIVQLGGGERDARYIKRFDPGFRIPPEATDVHGISDDDVRGCPRLDEREAKRIVTLIGDRPIVAFNGARFDIPMLTEELERVGVRGWAPPGGIVDVQNLFHALHPRDLIAAAARYLGEDITEHAHGALTDAVATARVLVAMIGAEGLPADPDGLLERTAPDTSRYVDPARRFTWRYREPCFAFGKHEGRLLRAVVDRDPGYLRWMLDGAGRFDMETLEVVRDAMAGIIRRSDGTEEVEP